MKEYAGLLKEDIYEAMLELLQEKGRKPSDDDLTIVFQMFEEDEKSKSKNPEIIFTMLENHIDEYLSNPKLYKEIYEDVISQKYSDIQILRSNVIKKSEQLNLF